MPKKRPSNGPAHRDLASSSPIPHSEIRTPQSARPSPLLDTRVIYCGDNLDQLPKFPDAMTEISSFFRKSGKSIIPFTVKEILEDQLAPKLA